MNDRRNVDLFGSFAILNDGEIRCYLHPARDSEYEYAYGNDRYGSIDEMCEGIKKEIAKRDDWVNFEKKEGGN